MNILEIRGLSVWFSRRSMFFGRSRGKVRAVTDVSFQIPEGKTVGLVGESGSGKSTIGLAVLNLIPVNSGSICFRGTDVTGMPETRFRPYRRHVQMIFQDPFGSLNPRWTILRSLGEPLRVHFPLLNASDRREKCEFLLQRVGLKPDHLERYPHEFSGGQRQRIGIARALAVEPSLIVCDEPVSALDVSVQAQIVNLLTDLQDELGIAYLFIGHDLAVIEHVSDEIIVLNRGSIVESGPSEVICRNPQHEYTRNLLASVPILD